jgi:hypothetical protein
MQSVWWKSSQSHSKIIWAKKKTFTKHHQTIENAGNVTDVVQAGTLTPHNIDQNRQTSQNHFKKNEFLSHPLTQFLSSDANWSYVNWQSMLLPPVEETDPPEADGKLMEMGGSGDRCGSLEIPIISSHTVRSCICVNFLPWTPGDLHWSTVSASSC